MIDWISTIGSLVTVMMCVAVIVAYNGRFRPRRNAEAGELLAAAICIAFADAALGTLYWDFIAPVARQLGGPEVIAMVSWFGIRFNIVVGGALLIIAAYLHLRSLWAALPPPERALWSPLAMPWYRPTPPNGLAFWLASLRL